MKRPTREQAAEVVRAFAGHLMDSVAETLPPDRYPPLTADEWQMAERVLHEAGIDVARLTADIARRVTAEQIAEWIGVQA